MLKQNYKGIKNFKRDEKMCVSINAYLKTLLIDQPLRWVLVELGLLELLYCCPFELVCNR